MTNETLKWLELSTPSASAARSPLEAGQPPCPMCGWPVKAGLATCDHCGHDLSLQHTVDLLAELALQLLPTEVEVVPAPDHWLDQFAPGSPELYRLRLQAEGFRTSSGFDRLICLDDISVDHYQHQLEAALRALRDMRGRALLADEVGLGKTIEAGIVMKELIERGLAETILILTPASLTWQWQEEMEAKFHETFIVLEQLDQLLALKSERRRRWLISLDRAKSPDWAEHLLEQEYDLLIVDEAHKLKNHRTQAYKFVSSLRNRYMLLLTATPVHNHLIELYNLISLLRPAHLGTRRAFRQNFVTSAPVAGAPSSPKRLSSRRTIYGTEDYVPDYLRKNRQARQEYLQTPSGRWILKAKRTDNFADIAILKLGRKGRQAVEEIDQLLALGYEVVDFEAIQTGFWGNIAFVCRLNLKERPPSRKQPRGERRAVPRNPLLLRQLLREVMIRNRRASVSVRFPPRQAAIYTLNLTLPERELYDKVTAYIWGQLRRQEQLPDQPSSGALKMTLKSLQKQLCSSPQAAARILKSLVDQQPDPDLTEALILAWGIPQGRKVAATVELLAQYPGKFLIFTDYLPSLEALHAALQGAGYETVVFHGGLSSVERLEAVRSFRQNPEVRAMISTQSGSEGHNLQFCHQMINYDLPWNPMRIEQRVGRLHRLGQQEAVSIFNLAANDTIEAYILDLLAHKIRMFELVIGELDLILGELGEQRSFEQYVEEVWARSYSEAELQQMIAELENILQKAHRTYESVRSASDELSDLLEAFDEVHAR